MKSRKLGNYFLVVAALAGMALLSQCADEGFVPDVELAEATSMTILSGNNQYSFHGTDLPDPLLVEVKTSTGDAAQGVVIRFTVTQGGGSVSAATALSDEKGRASTRLTLGDAIGPNQVRAAVEANPVVAAVFDATSANFFCPEAEDNFQISYGPPNEYFLFTPRSALYPSGSSGIVQINQSSQIAAGFAEVPGGNFFEVTVWDGVFSPRGDYFVSARRQFRSEIVKVAADGTATPFAELTASAIDYGAELASNPIGLLVGCDNDGPFVVRCRDTLLRFPEATYSGGVNNDAVAVDPRRHDDDPLGEDIYFIHKTNGTLYRLPMDSLEVEPQGLQTVAQLTPVQAASARGMVCDGFDGSVYILVDADSTKELLQVTTAGVVTQEYNFFDRGDGSKEAAGQQRDLALRRPWLVTIDTYNDKLIVYDYLSDTFNALFADSVQQAKLSRRDDMGNLAGNERIGLDVLR